MTFYESNPEVKSTGAEVAEFDDAPPVTEERPWPGEESPATGAGSGTATGRPGAPTILDERVDKDAHTFTVQLTDRTGAAERCTLLITATAASVWNTSERDAAEALAGAIDTAVPRPLPGAFRFASDTVPPSLPLAAVCQEIATGRWEAFVERPASHARNDR